MSEAKLPAGPGFERLVEIMARLRAPDGCPWDREQNFDTIKRYLLEETYEVMDSVNARDWEGLADELGDVLLQAVFFAQMAKEEGRFDISDSVHAICSKLVRRHPHIFADGEARTADDVSRRWDEIKAEENKGKAQRKGLLEGVPRSLPALVEASQIASRAARAGFDWENIEQVFDKLREELGELHEARAYSAHESDVHESDAHESDAHESDAHESDAHENGALKSAAQENGALERVEDELGDLLFVVVNIARFLKVDPEQALRRTNAKFRRRFAHVEAGVEAQGKTLPEAGIAAMEALWQAAKQKGV